jgi:Zn-dependent peptidase ImmA (M78 family)
VASGWQAGALAADELRLERGLRSEPITDLWGLIDETPDLRLAFHDFGTDADGLYRWSGRTGLIVVNSREQHFGRKRFTAAHELGHHVMHRGATVKEIVDQDVFASGRGAEEVEANAFAAYLLAPTAAMRAAFGDTPTAEISVSDVVDMMIRFGISFTVAVNRLHNAERISARDRDRLKEESAGEILWTLSAKGKGEEPVRSPELPPDYLYEILRSYRSGLIDDQRLGELLLLTTDEAIAAVQAFAPAEDGPREDDLGDLGKMMRDALTDTQT